MLKIIQEVGESRDEIQTVTIQSNNVTILGHSLTEGIGERF